jgi:hypothetical protein
LTYNDIFKNTLNSQKHFLITGNISIMQSLRYTKADWPITLQEFIDRRDQFIKVAEKFSSRILIIMFGFLGVNVLFASLFEKQISDWLEKIFVGILFTFLFGLLFYTLSVAKKMYHSFDLICPLCSKTLGYRAITKAISSGVCSKCGALLISDHSNTLDIQSKEAEERKKVAEDEEKRKAEEAKEKARRCEHENKKSQRGPASNMKRDELYYMKVLGIKDNITPENLKKRYRLCASMYHPDKVNNLGDKLKEVAEKEMKEINEAYNYFKIKYKI